jgi:dsDNA-specific endonuclease/ATPase MutS2
MPEKHAPGIPPGNDSKQPDAPAATDNGANAPLPAPLPIDGALDLHTFRPQDLGDLIPAYLDECRAAGILEVRIIHGKGIGNVKRSVQAILARLSIVQSFADASAHFGGAGATIVHLRKP